jgi:hypothetical protein
MQVRSGIDRHDGRKSGGVLAIPKKLQNDFGKSKKQRLFPEYKFRPIHAL